MTKRHFTDTTRTIVRTAFGAAVLLAAGVCAKAMAETPPEPATAAQSSVPPIGEATRNWLALQRSHAEAAPALPVLGAQAGLAYERYLNSFKNKIPGSFDSTLGAGSNALRAGYTNVGGAAPAGAN